MKSLLNMMDEVWELVRDSDLKIVAENGPFYIDFHETKGYMDFIIQKPNGEEFKIGITSGIRINQMDWHYKFTSHVHISRHTQDLEEIKGYIENQVSAMR